MTDKIAPARTVDNRPHKIPQLFLMTPARFAGGSLFSHFPDVPEDSERVGSSLISSNTP